MCIVRLSALQRVFETFYVNASAVSDGLVVERIFCLVGDDEGGSTGLSKFAHMAMKELEELREAVREKGSSKMDKEAASASQKRKEVPLEVKKKSPRKKKPMGGGFGTIKKK